MPEETFVERVARKRAEKEAESGFKFNPDDIPDASTPPRQPDEIDKVIETIGIVEAYQRWSGKEAPTRIRDGENKWHCPLPNHPDSEPSFSMDTKKNVWNCFVCEQGGDRYDLAAIKFGYPFPDGYKSKELFPKLKADIAADLGWNVSRNTTTGDIIVSRPDQAKQSSTGKSTAKQVDEPSTPPNVIRLPGDIKASQGEDYDRLFRIKWRDLVPDDTFLHRWCRVGATDDLPEEYYFWLGLMVVGASIGRSTFIDDGRSVYGNLFISLVGSSGLGKSKSIANMVEFVRNALPYDESSPNGTLMVPSPGSAEALIDAFASPEYGDPTDPKKITGYRSVRGIVRFDEFTTLAGRASRSGSILKPILMEFFDSYNAVELSTRGAGHVRAESPFCSVLTTTQPRTLTKIFAQADADSGFLNRWVFARGVTKPLVPAMTTGINFDECIEPIRDIRAWSASHTKIVWTADGMAAWAKFFRSHLEPHRIGDEPLLARLDLLMKKLMLLFCADAHQDKITVEVVEKVTSLYEYLLASYNLIGKSLGMGEVEECTRELEEVLERFRRVGKSQVSFRDILRGGIGKRYPRDMIARSIRVMVDVGLVDETVLRPTHGPAVKTYGLALGSSTDD